MDWVLSSFAGKSILICSGDHSPRGLEGQLLSGKTFCRNTNSAEPQKQRNCCPCSTILCAPDALCTVPPISTQASRCPQLTGEGTERHRAQLGWEPALVDLKACALSATWRLGALGSSNSVVHGGGGGHVLLQALLQALLLLLLAGRPWRPADLSRPRRAHLATQEGGVRGVASRVPRSCTGQCCFSEDCHRTCSFAQSPGFCSFVFFPGSGLSLRPARQLG